MTHHEKIQRMATTLQQTPELLHEVAAFLFSDAALLSEDGHEVAEQVCVATFGERVECACGSLVFPGFLCWGCEEWTAPERP